jgi:hypothetical protein
MYRAEINATIIITGGGDEESMEDVVNEIVNLEIELDKGARNYFHVQKRPLDLRVSFQLINLEERIKIFSNPKFKSREVIRYLEGEERPDANIN